MDTEQTNNKSDVGAFFPNTKGQIDFKCPSVANTDGSTTYFGENATVPENPYARHYSGDNKVHPCKNTKTDSKDGRDLYYVRVAGPGRGQVELLLTEVEYTRAQRRAIINRADIPKPMTLLEFLKVLFIWK